MEDLKSVEAICGGSYHGMLPAVVVDVKQADGRGRPLDHDEVVRGQNVRVGYFFCILYPIRNRVLPREGQRNACSLHTTHYTLLTTHYTLLTTHYNFSMS